MAMASKETLKRMVMQFRVSDLNHLLESVGEKARYGRKKDLQKKVLQLISSKKTATLHHKIFQLHQNLSNKDDSGEADTAYYPSYKEELRHLRKQFWPSARRLGYNDVYDSSDSEENAPIRFVNIRNNYFKYDITKLPQKSFKKLPFFEYKSEVLPITPLAPTRQDDDSFECVIPFVLPEIAESHLNSYDSDNCPLQVQVRICLLDDQTDIVDTLPLSLSIKVNDSYCVLPSPIPSTNRQGMLLKRMNIPINITSEIYHNRLVNNMVVRWSVECEELYGLTIHLVRKFTAEELIQNLKNKGERDPNLTKKAIYDNLNDEDNEIAATSLKMSLMCPLGKIRISLPTRASTCNHLQCFDGTLYIKMNDVKSTWQCPVCNQTCLYDNLFIDGYFADVLRSKNCASNFTEIELDADGNWTPVESRKRKLSDSSLVCKELPEKKSQPAINCVNESSSLEEDLQNFYYQYNRETEMCNYNSSFPILPSFHEINDHFMDVKQMEEPELSVISEHPPHNKTKKNVMLVDLTVSDSDSDDVRSLSDNSYESDSSVKPDNSPPVYDISDSDSDNLSY